MANIRDKELKNLFDNIHFIFKNITHLREHLDIVFVFGKNASEDSIRRNFLNFIQDNNSTQFNFITIENLYDDLVKYSSVERGVKSKKIHLANLELNAIENAYSILIFPESPGSFAELGYFSAIKGTREKIIVSNHVAFANEKSYVSSLIELIHDGRESNPIILSSNNPTHDFTTYLTQLNQRFTDYDNEIYITQELQDHYMFPIAIIYELIKLFPYLIYSELKVLIKHVFTLLDIEKDNFDDYISSMISLLVISGRIERDSSKTVDTPSFIVSDQSFSCFKFNKFSEKEQKKILDVEMQIFQKKGLS